jgi:type II secretory pathway predicted ATPase ExeA
MYCQFYQLTNPPFQPTADHDFLWEGRNYLKALEALKYGLNQHRGLSLLTGEAGSGKTTVIRALLKVLDQTVVAALLPDSRLTVQEFYALVAHSFSLPGQVESRDTFHASLRTFLQDVAAEHKQVLLVIDEAQQLSSELIEEIDALLDLQTEDSDRLNICLVGQRNNNQEFGGRLDLAYAEHVMVRYILAPFTLVETCQYIQHRLHAAGADREIFTEDALAAVHQYSRGYPGQINIICDLALFSGCNENQPEINAALIQTSAEKMQFPEPEDVSGIEQHGESAGLAEESVEFSVPGEADLVAGSGRSYAMPVLVVLVGLILLGGGFTYYKKHVWVVLPTEPTAAGPVTSVEKVEALLPSLPPKKDDRVNDVVEEQRSDGRETAGAMAGAESLSADVPVVEEKLQAVIDDNSALSVSSSQEIVAEKELQSEKSLAPESNALETSGYPESKKTLGADSISSVDDPGVETEEQVIFLKDVTSTPAAVEDTVVPDEIPVAQAGPATVSGSEQEEKPAVVIGTGIIVSSPADDSQQEAGNAGAESVSVDVPVVEEKLQAVIDENSAVSVPSSQEIVVDKELQIEKSLAPETDTLETSGYLESKKTLGADSISSADDPGVETEKVVIFPKNATSAPADVEEVVVPDEIPIAHAGPATVTGSEKEEKPAVVVAPLSDHDQQQTVTTQKSIESVVSPPKPAVVDGRAELQEKVATSGEPLSSSVTVNKPLEQSSLPVTTVDAVSITGMDWESETADRDKTVKTLSSDQKAEISSAASSPDDEYGAGELSVSKGKNMSASQSVSKKETVVAWPFSPPVETVEKKKIPSRAAVVQTTKENKKATENSQAEDVIDWLLSKKRNKENSMR